MASERFVVRVEELGAERDYRSRLVIIRNGERVREELDFGEPEDNYFSRDWAWVQKAIEEAYRFGYEDGKTDGE